MTDMPEVAMDVKGLIERATAYVPFNHFKDGPLVAELATALSTLSRELAEARAERDAITKIADSKDDLAVTYLNDLRAAEAASASKDERIAALEAAISWALGEGDSDFGDNKPENAKPFWWRTELRARARSTKEPT